LTQVFLGAASRVSPMLTRSGSLMPGGQVTNPRAELARRRSVRRGDIATSSTPTPTAWILRAR